MTKLSQNGFMVVYLLVFLVIAGLIVSYFGLERHAHTEDNQLSANHSVSLTDRKAVRSETGDYWFTVPRDWSVSMQAQPVNNAVESLVVHNAEPPAISAAYYISIDYFKNIGTPEVDVEKTYPYRGLLNHEQYKNNNGDDVFHFSFRSAYEYHEIYEISHGRSEVNLTFKSERNTDGGTRPLYGQDKFKAIVSSLKFFK